MGRLGAGVSIPPAGEAWGQAYLDLALIFLLLRFSLRIRFLRHLARIAPAFGVVNSSKPHERKSPM